MGAQVDRRRAQCRTAIKNWSKTTCISGPWVRNAFGSKAFPLAMLQCGANMMPGGAPGHAHTFASQRARAAEYLEGLALWIARFAEAISEHRHSDASQAARRRSGTQRSKSGLTEGGQQQRTRRGRAPWRLRQAKDLEAETERVPELRLPALRKPAVLELARAVGAARAHCP